MLDDVERSKIVVIARVIAIEKTQDEKYRNGTKTTMIAEKVFKGSIKAGKKMEFAQGQGSDCIAMFHDDDVNRTFLFYLNHGEDEPDVWTSTICSRSGPTEYRSDDLLYLNNLEKVRGRTRLSGTLRYYQPTAVEGTASVNRPLTGNRVQLLGKDKSFSVTTDRNGVYEIYDLPAGNYEVVPEIPKGWKIFSVQGPPRRMDRVLISDLSPHSINLENGKHTYFDFHFGVSNALRGIVHDPDGNPMPSVCTGLEPANGTMSRTFRAIGCSTAQGGFEIKDVPPGSYVLAVNAAGRISSREPFRKFYYPNSVDRQQAAILTVGAGELIDNLVVRVPSIQETITVEGVVLYSNGKPVVAEEVRFDPDKKVPDLDAESRTTTNNEGRFQMKILKGISGQLYGSMFTLIGEFENCPALESEIKKKGNPNNSAILSTQQVPIKSDVSIDDVELRFPFPGCKKAKFQ